MPEAGGGPWAFLSEAEGVVWGEEVEVVEDVVEGELGPGDELEVGGDRGAFHGVPCGWSWLVMRLLQSIRTTRRPCAAMRSGVQRSELVVWCRASRTGAPMTPCPQGLTCHPRWLSSWVTRCSWASPVAFLL